MKKLYCTFVMIALLVFQNDIKGQSEDRLEQRLTLITLGVKDLKKSVNFYSDILGWQKKEYSTEAMTFYQLNGFLMALYPLDKQAEDAGVAPDKCGYGGITLSYYTRTRGEVDRFTTQLEKEGVKIIKAPEEAFWGGYRSYFEDPDGYLWEIVHNPLDNEWQQWLE